MTNVLPSGLTNCLLWSDELGIGYHARPPIDYKGAYFTKYQKLDDSGMGKSLTASRLAFVKRHFDEQVLDIGIGGGRFVTEANALGFDVNPEAIAWLGDRYLDPYQNKVKAISCWDSLEHIQDPESLVGTVTDWVFVSMPIYNNQEDCLLSKHFKPGEHIWYWTRQGLCYWFEKLGFELIEENKIESDLGREGIESFAFRKRN